jgi:O-antigen ligase
LGVDLDSHSAARITGMSITRLALYLEKFRQVFWALFLVTLPVTSFPFFPPAIGGSALVRPLAIYPLIILLIITTIPYLFTRPLPPTIVSLAPFLLIIFASSLVSLLYGIAEIQNVSVIERLGRAFVTIGMGAAFYLTVALAPLNREDLRRTLRWLYLGIAIALAWGSAQAIYVIHYSGSYFKLLNKIQRYVSIRRLFSTRVSGLTYEPNWFAQQISFLILPWLIASVLTGFSIFRWRRGWVTIELFLLIWSLVILVFTFSRAGLIIMVTLLAVSVLFLLPTRKKVRLTFLSRVPVWTQRLLGLIGGLIVVASLIFMAGRNNEFFSRLWNYWQTTDNPSISDYFNYLGFGARLIYAETAFNIYNEHPLLGVGPGNYAFFFEENIPERPIAWMPEVLRLITPSETHTQLVTPKNLYLRLLAETGVLGIASFLVFLIAIFGCALYLLKSKVPEYHYWGTASILAGCGFIVAAFTFDSFALPNMWVVFGLITAGAAIFRREQKASITSQEPQPSS